MTKKKGNGRVVLESTSGRFRCAESWSEVGPGPVPAPGGAPPRALPAPLGLSAAVAHDPSLFPRLVLGWINADFHVQIRIFQHFPSSTRKSSYRKQISKSLQNFTEFCECLRSFLKFSENHFKSAKFCKKIYKKFAEFSQNFAKSCRL